MHASVSKATYDEALAALQLQKGVKCTTGSHLKFWCKKHFKLQKIGSKSVLYCLKTSNSVVPKEEIFETIK